jgi:hypothetical protein
MLRSIADIARSEGEDLSDPEAALSCVEVFALGGRVGSADVSESGYFAVRGMLAKTVTEAARFVAERGVLGRLLDHFNDAMAAGVNQHRPVVDDRVAVFASAVFPRHFVVRHAFFRKFDTHPDIALIAV